MLKLKSLNCNGVERETIIDTTTIVGISERKQEPQELFDEYDNVVETRERESTYVVFLNGGREITITKATYDELVAKLKVEEL